MKKIKKFLKALGPGIVTGAADDDPSGIATYSQTGAQFGYSQLWVSPLSFPFMTAVQEMCGRIGLVTGKGLAGVIKIHYSKSVLYFAVFLLFVANTVNVGANLGAMASAGQLLFNTSFVSLLTIFTLVTIFLVVFMPYKIYSQILKYLAFSLFAYVVTVFVVKQDWQSIAYSTLVPKFSFDKVYLLNIVALLGTTISPYLFFWQASEEVEEEVQDHRIEAMDEGIPLVSAKDIRVMRLDTIIGMFFSNLIMFFIIATTASTLFVNGITEIESAAQAAEALKPVAGNFAFLLFAGGIIGTGLLSIPVLSGASSYALSETFGKPAGLSRKFKDVPWFYSIIAISILIGVFINFLPIPSFKLLYYTAVFNGLCAPPLLILIMLISNNKKIMGQRTNNKLSNILGWAITLIMTVSAIALLLSLF